MKILKNEFQTIIFPSSKGPDWQNKIASLLNGIKPNNLNLELKGWLLNYREINELVRIIEGKGFKIITIKSSNIETIVSLNSLGLKSQLSLDDNTFSTIDNKTRN